jgi:hypothetical protein
MLKITTDFLPPAALGRIQPGQPARLRLDAALPIPLQHGLPGTVEVEVDHVSPATLVLRTAGPLFTMSGTSCGFQGGRGADV